MAKTKMHCQQCYPVLFVVYLIFVNVLVSSEEAHKSAKIELRPDEKSRIPVLSYKLAGPRPWQNIPEALDVRNFNATALCARGSWLLYEEPEFETTPKSGLKGVTLLANDDFSCIPINEMKLGSAQLLTSWTKRKVSTITFFPYINFGGPDMIVQDLVKQPVHEPTETTTVHSFVTVGQQHWTVVFTNGERLCIKPPQDSIKVCFVSNIFGRLPPATGVSTVRKGCKISDPGLTIDLAECYAVTQGKVNPIKEVFAFKSGEPGPNNSTGNATTPKPSKDNCPGVNDTDILDAEQLSLIEARLKGTLGTDDWMQAIKNPKNIWRIELFEKAFTVFMAVCPSIFIDTEYLLLFSSLFFYHLDKVWESGKYVNPAISDLEWRELMHEMGICISNLDPKMYEDLAKVTISVFSRYSKFEEVTQNIDSTFGYRPNYDHVMEINWLMANIVGSVCSKANSFNIDFTHRFYYHYDMLYFAPIENQWKTPGKIAVAYQYIFGGYGMQKTLAKIAVHTVDVMAASGMKELYRRPIEQKNSILLPIPKGRAGNSFALSQPQESVEATTEPED